MHSIVLLAALTAASGTAYNGSTCPNGQCGATYTNYQNWTYYSPTTAQSPRTYAPQYAPAAPATSWTGYNVNPYYYYYYPQNTATCTTGNCPRR